MIASDSADSVWELPPFQATRAGCLIFGLLVCLGWPGRGTAQEPVDAAWQEHEAVADFLTDYCVDCHHESEPSGDRDFETLLAIGDPTTTVHDSADRVYLLRDAIDQLTLGTMPPPDATLPSDAERVRSITQMRRLVKRLEASIEFQRGGTRLRRLTGREYHNTLSDLFGLNLTLFDSTATFPSENVVDNFDNVGDALVTSAHQLEGYLNVAEAIVTKARAKARETKSQRWVFEDNFYQQAELRSAHEAAFQHRYLCLYDHPLNDKPEGAYGHLDEFGNGVPHDGIYRVRVLVEPRNRDTPYGNKAVRIDLDEPFRLGIVAGDTRLDDMVHTQPMEPKLAEFVLEDGPPRWVEASVHLDKHFAPRFTFVNGIHDVRGSFGRVFKYHRETLPKAVQRTKGIFRHRIAVIEHGQMPHIRIHRVEIEGPVLTDTFSAEPGPNPFLTPVPDSRAAREKLLQFATHAFRRPVKSKELKKLNDLMQHSIDHSGDVETGLSDAVQAVLCSPSFLYFQSTDKDTQLLSEHGLAERLAYFLSSSMPDARLRELADQGSLSDASELRRQCRRLLKKTTASRFVADFLDSWLSLRDLGSMPPEQTEFWQFYAGQLESDMKRETQLFVEDLIQRDATALACLNATHSFVNRDLAKLYGVVDAVSPEEAHRYTRVALPAKERAGLLSHASVLTVSANGIETSPVTRGVWVLENLLGTPPPEPPDDVPAIDPDIRGAKTIREQLQRHRDDAACAQCHRRIDPYGFALEVFDPIGAVRSRYPNQTKIDASGILPSGDAFDGLAELQPLLEKRKSFFLRHLTECLFTHALGRKMTPADRSDIDQVLERSAEKNHGFASLIEEVVMSDLFRG
ncbi:MAG: DUF1592 domain-containing protein [Planctomycetota bacterium]